MSFQNRFGKANGGPEAKAAHQRSLQQWTGMDWEQPAGGFRANAGLAPER